MSIHFYSLDTILLSVAKGWADQCAWMDHTDLMLLTACLQDEENQ